MNIEDFEPNLGASTPEASLKNVLFNHYRPWFSPEKSRELADQYIAELKKHIAVEQAVESLGRMLYEFSKTYDYKTAYLGDAKLEAREIISAAMNGE